MITVRKGEAADAAGLAELAAATFRDAFAAANTPADLALHLAQSYGVAQQGAELADPGILTLIAFDSEAMAGYAQLCRSEPPPCVATAGALELWRFYVSQSWHGRGVAQAFYRKAGFAEVGSKVFVVGTDAQTDRVMLKVLPAPQAGTKVRPPSQASSRTGTP
ncbi:MAG: GNAT family N-acetyltransferase [Steroidobacteraceae bacterium]